MPQEASNTFSGYAVEAFAKLAHESWSGWMRYLFQNGTYLEDGGFAILPGKTERWRRQMETPYEDLPESEKESDREEAKKYLRALTPPVVVERMTDAFGHEGGMTLDDHAIKARLYEPAGEVPMTEEARFVLLLRTGAKRTAHHVLPYAQARARAIAGEQYDLWQEFSSERDAKATCTDYNDTGRVIPPGNGV